MTPVQHDHLHHTGWVIPTPQLWPFRVFLAASFLARLHQIRIEIGEYPTGRYG